MKHITEIEIKLQKAESTIYYLKEEIKAYEIAVLHVKTLMPKTYAELENSSFFHFIHYREPLKYYKTKFKLNGDMAQQFNETYAQDEFEDDGAYANDYL